MANQSSGSPRFYIDYTQLAKAKGFLHNPSKFFWQNTSLSPLNALGLDDNWADRNTNVWNFDPSHPTEYTTTVGNTAIEHKIVFWDVTDNQANFNREWAKLMTTVNWGGIFNHNLGTAYSNSTSLTMGLYNGGVVSMYEDDIEEWNTSSSTDWNTLKQPFQNVEEIVNAPNVVTGNTGQVTPATLDYNGYTIFTGNFIDDNLYYADGDPINGDRSVYSGLYFRNEAPEWSDFPPNFKFKIGAYGFGKYIDINTPPDLSIKRSFIYDGHEITRSLNGSDFLKINHQGAPAWLSGEPWRLNDVEINGTPKKVGRNGRRAWDLKFSYISKNNDVFYDWSQSQVGGTATYVEGLETSFISTGNDFNGSTSGRTPMQEIWDLTLGGALAFVFCPDSTKTDEDLEFAICKLDTDTFTADQVSYNSSGIVWNVRIKIIEVW